MIEKLKNAPHAIADVVNHLQKTRKRKEKNMKKRILCLMLTLCLFLPILNACKNDQQEETASGDNTTTSNPEETKNKYDVYDDLGDLTFDGREITIGRVDRSLYDDEVSVERYTGDIVNDAIFKRNQLVENRLDIVINDVPIDSSGYAISNAIRTDMQSGTHNYDLTISPVYATIMYTGEGLLSDLTKTSHIDLSKPYWSQYFNECLSIGGSQYMASGAISLSYYRYLYVTIVNDTVLNSHTDAPNLIDVVNAKKWTLEYQKELTAQYYVDNGGNGKDETDGFGLITTDYNGVDGYWSSCEMPILEKDADDYYTLSFGRDRMSNVVDTVITMFSQDSTWCVPHDPSHETGVGEWDAIYEKFAEGNALMATIKLEGVEKPAIRNMSDTYTILPIPKYDEAQQTYYSFVQDSFTGMAIPATAPEWDRDVSSAVMEAMASESYRTVTPAYYETALKAKYVKNPESVELLDMIATNVYIDGGEMYTKSLLSISQKFREIVATNILNGDLFESRGTYNVGSSYSETFLNDVQTKLDELQASIKKIQGNQ